MIIKKRLDTLVLQNGLANSREKAKCLIMEGKVYVDNQKADKPGMCYSETAKIEMRGEKMPFVSRGGYKLKKALDVFNISINNKVCIDIGASTGGFTDCMLKSGAKKVYSVDVGYGQLDWNLRNDDRVINLERTNIRYATNEQIPELADFFSIDVSFISLCIVLPVARQFLKDNGTAVCLIKPQFEAGKNNVGKNGVVRDSKVHKEVILKIINFAKDNGFDVLALDFSPIKGPKGNIEYLIYLKKCENNTICANIDVKNVLGKSYIELNGGEGF